MTLKRPPRPQTNPPPAVSPNPDVLARAAGFRRIAGVDEAGRGPWAGPVVAAAVLLRCDHLPVRIDDSKRLTRPQRNLAFDVICQSAHVGLGIVCADEIDRSNSVRATLLAMQQAIAELPHPPELILVDGAQAPAITLPCWPILRGDQRSFAIGCASIVAKVVRDRLMAFYHELDPRYHFDQHKGYGTLLHSTALRAVGPCALHRLTFQPVASSLAPSAQREPRGRHSVLCEREADALAVAA